MGDDAAGCWPHMGAAHAHAQLAAADASPAAGFKPCAQQPCAEGCPQPASLQEQQGGPSVARLRALLQQELASITQDGSVLGAAHQLLLQQHDKRDASSSTGLGSAAQLLQAAAPPGSAAAAGARGHQLAGTAAASPPARLIALPLVGLCLMRSASQQLQLQEASSPQQPSRHDRPSTAGAASASDALWAAVLGDRYSSPFLQALQAELQRLHSLISSCYVQVEQQLVALARQHLPPAPNSSSCSSSHCGDAAVQQQGWPAGASAGSSPARSTSSSKNSHYGSGLDLASLQQQADGLAAALVRLDDLINSSCSKLADLARQFDTAISAAALSHQQPGSGTASDTAAAAVDGPRGHTSGLLAALKRRLSGHEPGMAVAGAAAAADRGAPAMQRGGPGPELQLLTPGVSSHSSSHSHNKYTAGVPADAYHQAIHKLLTPSGATEPILWGLSVVYTRLRHATDAAAAAAAAAGAAAAGGTAEAAATAGGAAWQAPDKFTRSTTKFWVHPAHVLRLKLALLRQLPLLVYGATDPLFAADISSGGALRAGSRGVTSLISSVYFDSPGLDVYHTRLARDDQARLLRLRYYGPRQLGPAGGGQHVFVERKTHREAWTGERSVKERASLLQRQVPAFLAAGALPPGELSKGKEQLLQQVHEYLASWEQLPALRTEYHRTAWQRYDSNSVRLSLDEHMLLLREGRQPAADGDWCAALEGAAELPAWDAVRFPYAILEIKLQEEAPAWVGELEASGVLVKAPRFSKFLHGMKMLHPSAAAASPSWFLWDERRACAVPASLDEMRELARERDAWKQQEQHEQAAGGVVENGPLLAALRIPRFSLPEAGALPPSPGAAASSSATLPAAAGGPRSHALGSGSSNASASRAAKADQGGVLTGLGLHSPRCSQQHVAGGHGQADRSSCDLSGFGSRRSSGDCGAPVIGISSISRPCAGGGSGPFNAGINAVTPLAQHHSQLLQQQRPGALHSDTSSAASLGSNAAPAGAAAAAVWRDGAACAGSDSGLCVTNPLDRRVLHYKAGSMSSCSMSSLDTVTTGGGTASLLHPHSHSHGHGHGHSSLERRSSTSCHSMHSIPCNGSPTASLGAAAAAAGSFPAAGSRDSSSWQLPASVCLLPVGGGGTTPAAAAGPQHTTTTNDDVVLNMDQLERSPSSARAGGAAPGSAAAGCRAAAGKQLALLQQQQQQHLMQPQPQVIQVNYVLQQPDGACGQVADAATADEKTAQDAAALNPQLLKLMQQLLPPMPVTAGTAPAAGTAAAKADGVQRSGSDGSSVGSGGGRSAKRRGLLQQVKAAAGRLRGSRGQRDGWPLELTAGGRRGWSLLSKGPRPEGRQASSRVRTRAEPKTFFANERTFLAWLNLSVLVMMTGLGLLSGSTIMASGAGIACSDTVVCSAARISGAIISPVAIVFMCYALHLFRKRTRQILDLSTMRYDDQHGPALLTVLLVGVTVVAVVLGVLSWRASSSAG